MASAHQLSKKERVRAAREVRKLVGLYVLHSEHNISLDGVDWDDIAWDYLGKAAVALSDLIERERAIRASLGKED